MEYSFRFVDEYANFKRRQAKKDYRIYSHYYDKKKEKAELDERLKNIDSIVTAMHRGLITLDEGMKKLAELE